jgi:hypothetical protein
MERIDTDTLHFSYVVGYIPLALPLGELPCENAFLYFR